MRLTRLFKQTPCEIHIESEVASHGFLARAGFGPSLSAVQFPKQIKTSTLPRSKIKGTI